MVFVGEFSGACPLRLWACSFRNSTQFSPSAQPKSTWWQQVLLGCTTSSICQMCLTRRLTPSSAPFTNSIAKCARVHMTCGPRAFHVLHIRNKEETDHPKGGLGLKSGAVASGSFGRCGPTTQTPPITADSSVPMPPPHPPIPAITRNCPREDSGRSTKVHVRAQARKSGGG